MSVVTLAYTCVAFSIGLYKVITVSVLQYLWLKPPSKDANDHSGQTARRSAGKPTYRISKRDIFIF